LKKKNVADIVSCLDHLTCKAAIKTLKNITHLITSLNQLNGIFEASVTKTCRLSKSSLLVDELISIEINEESLILLADCILFRIQLPFECINFFKKNNQGQRFIYEFRYGFKASLLLLFEIGNCSAISFFVVVLVTIVTTHVVSLKILRILA
jgi:hypothetical protein